MGRIAVLADPDTSRCFRLSGVRASIPVTEREQAIEAFNSLCRDEGVSLIMVTAPVFDWIQPYVGRMKSEYPLVVTIPDRKGASKITDTLVELVKRTVGLELKVERD